MCLVAAPRDHHVRRLRRPRQAERSHGSGDTQGAGLRLRQATPVPARVARGQQALGAVRVSLDRSARSVPLPRQGVRPLDRARGLGEVEGDMPPLEGLAAAAATRPWTFPAFPRFTGGRGRLPRLRHPCAPSSRWATPPPGRPAEPPDAVTSWFWTISTTAAAVVANVEVDPEAGDAELRRRLRRRRGQDRRVGGPPGGPAISQSSPWSQTSGPPASLRHHTPMTAGHRGDTFQTGLSASARGGRGRSIPHLPLSARAQPRAVPVLSALRQTCTSSGARPRSRSGRGRREVVTPTDRRDPAARRRPPRRTGRWRRS